MFINNRKLIIVLIKMAKKKFIYFLLIVIIFILISISGYFFYQSQQKSKVVSFISDFETYSLDYSKQITSLFEVMTPMNYTTDYTTCIAKNNKLKEIQDLYSQDEVKKLAFLKSVSINTECQNALDKFSLLMESTKQSRLSSFTKTEKWCYGWHKVDWDDNWEEEYSTPMIVADNEMNSNEEKLSNAFLEAKVICLKQISK